MTLAESVNSLINWFTLHSNFIYPILFFGSFFETFIFSSFFIYGEIFFLAGSILASLHIINIWVVIILLYLGAIFGDTASYLLGHKLGSSFFKEHKKIFNMVNYNKGLKFFESHGNKAIFLSRVSGPISWITPFLAGIYKVPYKTFLIYNIAGVLIGVGQFIAIGYFFGLAFISILNYVKDIFIVVGIALVVAAIIFLIRKEKSGKSFID